MSDTAGRPIGVFDSGVGGLSVLAAIHAALPSESTVYLGDTARVPYGTKSAEVVRRYALACARELVAHDIKLLVVACNTASAVAIPTLEDALAVPVIGVIEPGARAAQRATQSGAIAIICTAGTASSGSYQRALEGSRLLVRPCPLLVPLVEEGWTQGEVPRLVVGHYLGDVVSANCFDTLVLGCTHFPLLTPVLREVVGTTMAFVDSGVAAAAEVVAALASRGLLNRENGAPRHTYLVTDTPAGFIKVGQRFLGHPIAEASHVELKMSRS